MSVIGVWRDGKAGADLAAGLEAAGFFVRTVADSASLPGECRGLVADLAHLDRHAAVVKTLREGEPDRFPVVAVLPPDADEGTVARALAVADEVVREPVGPAELTARLRLLWDLRRCRLEAREERAVLARNIKTLACLADVHAVIQRFDQPRERLFRGIAALLPSAMERPQAAGARILADGQAFASPGFAPGPHRVSFLLARSGQPDALLEAHYADAPFSPEETEFVRVVAERLERTMMRLRGDEALRREREYSALLMDTLPGGVVRFDRKGTIVFCNPRAEDILELAARGSGSLAYNDPGFFPETLEGHPLPPGGYPFDRVMATGKPVYDMVLSIARPKGGRRFVSVSAAPLIGPDGTIDEVVASVVDVTAQKDMERQLAHALKMESLGQLAAGIAHEINTPVQYVSGNLEFLANALSRLVELLDKQSALVLASRAGAQDLPEQLAAMLADEDLRFVLEETPAAIRESREGLDRVAAIVGSMKRFAHPDLEGSRPIDVAEAIDDALAVSRSAWKYVADVETDIEDDLPLVPFVSGEFNQALLNIIVNAAQAIEEKNAGTGDKGVISVSAARQGNAVRIAIADTGTGIPETARARVFDPFFTTKPVGKGTGQGLAIVHAIMARHKAVVDFVSRPGQGTTFFLTLPLAGTEPLQA
ncbi:PAS/PAC sensor signal transduction histidine kinase [Solidesulfovibrio fructosivorans JJ]]|uniref:histidine kinase n=1 Tax=Solidesulfovibrio fructosivorans JJ] TaxID=596151 RepID=E1JU28_SOLFR|nr:ATP-binding protein [Solidesulfovibrio fructosivorans]EFL51958.1 PAS/PAC sensor signal transduction histidine kinase [Solidesulfovibrio fructosivorans JJ]]